MKLVVICSIPYCMGIDKST